MSGFVDEAQIHAKAGDGGAGSVAFRREAHVDKGGPDGGDGGRGGDVWLEASVNVASLLRFKEHPHCRGTNGDHGSGKKRHGKSGEDVAVRVPVGTLVRDSSGRVLCDLSNTGDRWMAAEGGRGGRGNARFLSNKRRAPAFAEQGEAGGEHWLNAELKLMADAALVGFPSAGKSTIISVVSRAKPKIADYPFTTLEPHLGVVRIDSGHHTESTEFVMADIPGLIEGASEGKGLGHQFLRHIERARVLIIVLDLATNEVSPDRQRDILLNELSLYRPELLNRPRLVVGSKADLLGSDEAIRLQGDEFVEQIQGDLVVSAATGFHMKELVEKTSLLVQESREEQHQANAALKSAIVIHRPIGEGLIAEQIANGVWQLVGRPAERAVGFSDLNDPGAMDEAMKRLQRLGVDRVLARAGAFDGDEVQVGKVSFTWYRNTNGALGSGLVPDEQEGDTSKPGSATRAKGGRKSRARVHR